MTVRFVVRVNVHAWPFTESQPTQFPKTEPLFGTAFKITVVPFGKLVLHVLPHPSPAGELLTVPEPLPVKFTVRRGAPLPEPLPKHTTFAVMLPVTTAPDEDRPPAL